jgi:hypothetical protein
VLYRVSEKFVVRKAKIVSDLKEAAVFYMKKTADGISILCLMKAAVFLMIEPK